jgi:ATP-dependent DNA helicase PIF1
MKLKCDIKIQNLNQNDNYEKCYKDCTLSIYRAEESNDSTTNIILIIKPKSSSIELKYKLNKIETYTKFISEGKSTINLIDKKILLLISNTSSQSLINFISFLKIKFNKNKNINIDFDKENVKNTNNNNTYLNKLLNNVDCSYSKNSLKVISPLTNVEISDLMKKNKSTTPIRAAATNENRARMPLTSSSNALKELSVNNNNIIRNKQDTGIIKLTSEQTHVLKAIKDGKNIFFTGGAGTGKSFLLKMITKCLKSDNCFMTASTGVAACLIGGTTLHTFAGVTSNDLKLPVNVIVEKIKNSKAKLDNWKKCKHLIIDEISMIDADFFDTLNEIAQ